MSDQSKRKSLPPPPPVVGGDPVSAPAMFEAPRRKSLPPPLPAAGGERVSAPAMFEAPKRKSLPPPSPAAGDSAPVRGRRPLGVSVIVPAYNEEHGIGAVLEQLRGTLATLELPHELLVVDDGSTDGTAAEARKAEGVTVLEHRVNHGYGAALKTGIRAARYELVVITDADGTYPNETIPKLVERWRETDCAMAVGSRTGRNVTIPWIRRPAKWVIGRMANMVAGEPIPDINSGLRLFRRSLAVRLFPLLPDGFSFTTTITLALLTNGFRVEYLPIDYHARVGRSKIRPIRDTLGFMQLILRIALYFAPLKIFLTLAGVLLLSSVVLAIVSRVAFGLLADVSTVVLAAAAFQTAVVGLLAELVNRRLPNLYRDED